MGAGGGVGGGEVGGGVGRAWCGDEGCQAKGGSCHEEEDFFRTDLKR